MFTGLVETTGTVHSAMQTSGARRLVFAAPALASRWRQGDSIAVNGVCLTAIPLDDIFEQGRGFGADLAVETLQRTTLGSLAVGATVNLELPTPSGAPMGGHVVQGHVDGVGHLVSVSPLTADLATTDWRMTIILPAGLAANVIPQGSITVDGISLTVAAIHAVGNDGTVPIEIAVIPHTYRSTHLHTLAPGAAVNIETDVLARYARQAAMPSLPKAEWLTAEYLLANGY